MLYNVDDVVYLRESAAIGFLEAYTVSHIHIGQGGKVAYELSCGISPQTTTTFGERITHKTRPVLSFNESELVTKDEAIDLAITNHERQIAALTSLRG